ALGEYMVEHSHQAMLDEIAKLPKGTYHNSMRIDGYDMPLDLVAALTIADDGIYVDFDGTSGVSNKGINVPITYTQAYASFGVRCLVGSTVPNNAGSLSAVKVTAPEGSILNAPHPCAVAARHVTGQMLPDVVMGALHKAVAGKAPAEGTSCLWNPALMGGHGLVPNEDFGDATPFAVGLFHTGGAGARPKKDGLSATAFPSGVRNTPVEINESIAPIVVWRKEYRPDSGGPGEYRGGTGQIMEIASAEGAPFAIAATFDRVHHAPRGREGGLDGFTGKIELKSGTALRNKGTQSIPRGDSLHLEMPGGGGYGDPKARDPELVAMDVRDGMVSAAAALDHYGVVLDAKGAVDTAATEKRRAE
ncbi:MAG: hydantoinase B/oxoprolinase family protein, partial [Rhodospirillaceae bacterium]|nr:hydantoinase B/oxoprolinase family protein [Rhodospirillaceae bacterium]